MLTSPGRYSLEPCEYFENTAPKTSHTHTHDISIHVDSCKAMRISTLGWGLLVWKEEVHIRQQEGIFRHHAMRLMKPGAEISGGPQEGSLKGFLVTTVVRDVFVSIQIHSEPSKSEGYRLTCNLFMYPPLRRRWHKQKGPGDCSLMSWWSQREYRSFHIFQPCNHLEMVVVSEALQPLAASGSNDRANSNY